MICLLQIQFLLTIVHTLSAAVKPCGFPFGCLMFQSSYMATLVILFVNFYIKVRSLSERIVDPKWWVVGESKLFA